MDINSVPNTPTDHMHSTPLRDGEHDFVDESYIQQEPFVVAKETGDLSQVGALYLVTYDRKNGI